MSMGEGVRVGKGSVGVGALEGVPPPPPPLRAPVVEEAVEWCEGLLEGDEKEEGLEVMMGEEDWEGEAEGVEVIEPPPPPPPP